MDNDGAGLSCAIIMLIVELGNETQFALPIGRILESSTLHVRISMIDKSLVAAATYLTPNLLHRTPPMRKMMMSRRSWINYEVKYPDRSSQADLLASYTGDGG